VTFRGVTRTISRSTSPASPGGPCPRYFCQSGLCPWVPGEIVAQDDGRWLRLTGEPQDDGGRERRGSLINLT
jgi:hypothetical protein